jgi:transcriptional regulator with XRE-family HTH domain
MVSPEVNIFALPSYLGIVSNPETATLDFPQQLAALRKHHGLTQQALAQRIGIHVVQLRRYEGGTSQPTLDVIRRLATALSVSADLLLFGKNERGPDEDLRLQFEAVSRFDTDEKQVIRSLLEGMILKHEARRWSSVNGDATNGERK